MFSLEKWRLFRRRGNLERELARSVAKARAEGHGADEIERIRHDLYFELDMVDEEYRFLVTRRLLSQAQRWLLPISHGEENWERGQYTGWRYLTLKGIQELRTAIREENYARREESRARREAALTWASTIIGIIGALTGLLAVLLR